MVQLGSKKYSNIPVFVILPDVRNGKCERRHRTNTHETISQIEKVAY